MSAIWKYSKQRNETDAMVRNVLFDANQVFAKKGSSQRQGNRLGKSCAATF